MILNTGLYDGSLTQTDVAKIVGVTRRSVYTHKEKHLARDLAAIGEGRKDKLINALKFVEDKTEQILRECMQKKAFETALKAIARREAQIKLTAEITGELQEKAANEKTQARKAQQLEKAIEGAIRRAKENGISANIKDIINEIGNIEPSVYELLPLTRFAGMDKKAKVIN